MTEVTQCDVKIPANGLLCFVGWTDTNAKVVTNRYVNQGKIYYVTEDGNVYNHVTPVNLKQFMDTYPGSPDYVLTPKAEAIKFLNRGMNWRNFYVYFIEDEENRKYHEDMYYGDLPDKVIVSPWTKEWYRKRDRVHGTLCWVGKNEKEVFEKKRMAVIYKIHNDHLTSLGGSPNLYFLDENEKWHAAAKPVSMKELEFFSKGKEKISFEKVREMEKIYTSEVLDEEKSSAMDVIERALSIAKIELARLENSYPSKFSTIEELRQLEETYNKEVDAARKQVDDLEMKIIKMT
jgi:hypothetical protein